MEFFREGVSGGGVCNPRFLNSPRCSQGSLSFPKARQVPTPHELPSLKDPLIRKCSPLYEQSLLARMPSSTLIPFLVGLGFEAKKGTLFHPRLLGDPIICSPLYEQSLLGIIVPRFLFPIKDLKVQGGASEPVLFCALPSLWQVKQV